jgi:hypothetical protein
VGPIPVIDPSLNQIFATLGNTLICSTGEWTGNPTFAYRWQVDGEDHPQAVTAQHTVTLTDLGHKLTCKVTATNAAGSTEVISNPCSVAAPATNQER